MRKTTAVRAALIKTGLLVAVTLLLAAPTALASDLNLSTLSSSEGFTVNGNDSEGYSGQGTASGDINGDGIADLLVASGHYKDRNGYISVIYGSTSASRSDINLSSSLSSPDGFNITNINNGSTGTGNSASVAAGDVNGDGIDDVIYNSITNGPPGTEATYVAVVYGKTGSSRSNIDISSISATDGYKISGLPIADIDVAPIPLSGADVNDDGIGDITIGIPSAGKGAVYVVYGESGSSRSGVDLTSLATSDGYKIDGDSSAGSSALFAGYSVSTGDINADGINDIVTGAIFGDPTGSRSVAGSTFVIYGKSGSSRTNINLNSLSSSDGYRIDGALAGDLSGLDVAVGDVNGDGIGDVAVGITQDEHRYLDTAGQGYVAVVYGKSGSSRSNVDLASLATSDGYKIKETADAIFVSVRLDIADISGDGIGDVVASSQYIGAGSVFLVYGQSGSSRSDVELSSLAASDGYRINGIDNGDFTGSSLNHGDINGDSVSDLIIGANLRDNGSTVDAGSTFVLYGATVRTFALTGSVPKSMRSSSIKVKAKSRAAGFVTVSASVSPVGSASTASAKSKTLELTPVTKRVKRGKSTTFKLKLAPKAVKKKVLAALKKGRSVSITFVITTRSDDGRIITVTKKSKITKK